MHWYTCLVDVDLCFSQVSTTSYASWHLPWLYYVHIHWTMLFNKLKLNNSNLLWLHDETEKYKNETMRDKTSNRSEKWNERNGSLLVLVMKKILRYQNISNALVQTSWNQTIIQYLSRVTDSCWQNILSFLPRTMLMDLVLFFGTFMLLEQRLLLKARL